MTRRRLVLFAVAARDDRRLRSVVAWSCMAIVASSLVTGCGARSELPIPSVPYMVLLPTSVDDDDFTQTVSLWHSRTKTIATVGRYAFEQATMSFDGRFIAIDRCSAGACGGALAGGLDVVAPDGTTVWSQPETDGQLSWGWLGALRPDGQRVLIATFPPDPGVLEWSLCVLDRGSTPVPIRTESRDDALTEASYSPDGQTIVAVHYDASAYASETLVTMRDDGTQYTTLAFLDELGAGDNFYAPSFNFDGTAVVYTQVRGTDVQYIVAELGSQKSQIVYSGPQQPQHLGRFTPDGSAIVIQEVDETNVETLRHIDLATGEASILWQGHATPWTYVNVSVAVDD